MTREHDMQPKPKTQTWLSPDVAFCRARRFGLSDVVFCLMDDAQHCAFAISSGQSVFCRHPERERIIAQTNKTMPLHPLKAKSV
jgi:hypothetical protein